MLKPKIRAALLKDRCMVFSFWTFLISIFKKLTHSKVPSFLKKKIHFSALLHQIWLFNVKSGEKIGKRRYWTVDPECSRKFQGLLKLYYNEVWLVPGNIWALSSKGNRLFCDLGNWALWYLTVLLWRPNKYRSTLIFFSRKNLTHLLLYTSVTRFLASSFYLQDNESQLTGFV